MKNKKGFTLIELLAIILIIAVLLLIAMPLINNVIGSVRKRTCFLNTKSMEKAALNYVLFEGKKLPEQGSITIPLQEIINKGYVSRVVDPSDLKTDCDGYVSITEENSDYKTEGHLVCPTYCNAEEFVVEDKVDEEQDHYRGFDPNNWVLFGRYDQESAYGLLWRIVKTDDGGRKLIFEGLENGGDNPLEDGRAMLGATTGVPYDKTGNNKYGPSTINTELQKWLNNVYVVNKDKYIKKTNWKIGGIPFNNPTNLNSFIDLENKDIETEFGMFPGMSELSGVGMINPSDYMLSSSNLGCVSSYKLGGSFNPCIYTDTDLNNFLYKDKYHYWTMNPSSDSANKTWHINNIGHLNPTFSNSSIISARPVINIDKTLPFLLGSGTIDDPYILEDYMINIKDSPIITLIGNNPIVIREGDGYLDPGATAYDSVDGDLTDEILVTNNVNINIPGEYIVEYNVTDSDGNNAPTVTRNVIVTEVENPIITLNGENPLKLTLKHDYIEHGATALDPYYGDISEDIIIEGEVNTDELGVYEITYNVINKDGKQASEVTRKVIVEPPRPIITLNGDNPTNVYIGGSYEELGATAIDEIDGDITNEIVTEIIRYEVVKTGSKSKIIKESVSDVIVDKKYRYEIKYEVTNSYGITANKIRMVYILPDNGPQIEFIPNGSNEAKQGHDVQIKVTKTKYDIDNNSLKYMWVTNNWRLRSNSNLENVINTKFINNQTINKSGSTGLYKLYAIAKDIHGNMTIKATNYYKIDNSRPQLLLNGPNPQKILIEKPYVEHGARAYDKYYSGDITNRIQISGDVNTNQKGNYNVLYSVTDDAGNTTTRTRVVTVYLSKPVLTLKGSKTERVIKGQDYVEPGYKATDEVDGDITSNVIISGEINQAKEGIYPLTYSVTNSYGVSTTITRNIEVYIPSPEIKINGSNPLAHKVLEPYVDLGATATDLIDGDISNKIQVSSNINVNVKGKYEVIYTVMNANNKATTAKRIVNVYAQKPKVTLNGDSFVKVYLNDVFNDLGATAVDEIDGDLTNKIVNTGNVNTSKIGIYTLKYEVTNSFLETDYKIRTVQVVEPTVSITLKGTNPYDLKATNEYIEPGFIATHELLGDVTGKVKITSDLNVNKVGKYTITYNYNDSNLSRPVIATRTVNVTPPELELTLNGAATIELMVGSSYVELGATAIDELDGDISNLITITSTLNTNVAGNYTISYEVTSNYGVTKQVTRTVNVTPPELELTLNGAATIELMVGSSYVELGATAIDELDGDISNLINITSTLNTNVAGKYTISYEVTSNYGVRKQVTRTVNVVQTDGPLITLTPDGSSSYGKEFSVKIEVTKNIGDLDTSTFKYLWKTNNLKPSEGSFASSFTSGETKNTPVGESGYYYLWVMAKDVNNNTTIKSSNAYLLDNKKPVIKLNGPNVIEVPVDGIYEELGATVIEEHSGLNENGLVITSNVVPGILGTYTVTYNATDKVGLKADEIVRTVNVVEASLKDAPGDDFVPKYYSDYFIGKNPNNWVEFGNASDNIYDYVPMLWRIVKSNETGIKIIYEGTYNKGINPVENGKLDSSIFDENTSNYNNSSVKIYLENWYNDLNEPDKNSLTTPINWCIGGVNNPYDVDRFIDDQCLIKTTNKTAVGMLNSVDYLLTSLEPCNAYNQASCGTANFLFKNYDYMTINGVGDNLGSIFSVETNGALRRTAIDKVQGIRPVINLRSDVLIIGGEGTLKNPYKLNTRIPIIDNTPPLVTFEYGKITEFKKEHEVRVIVTDDISGVDPGSLKYVWTTSTTKPQETEFVNSFVNGELIKTPIDKTGTYYLWVLAKDRKGNQAITMSEALKLDNKGPVITLKGDNPYILSIGNPYIEPGATAIDNVDGDISAKIIITGIINPSIDGTYEILYEVSDSLGNKSIIARTVVVEDTTPPTVVFTPNGNVDYKKEYKVKVEVTDVHSGVDIDSLKYLWNTSTSQPSEGSFASSFTNGGTINTPADVTGGYYLWVIAKDNAGNTTITRSNVFNLDNTVPVISGVTTNATSITHDSFTITRSGNASDAHSGLGANPYIYQRSTNGSTWTTVCTNNTTNCNVSGLNENTTYYYRLCANDVLGNQSCTTSKSTKTIVVFACGQDFTDTRDSKVYKTTQIGTQCWFAENLRYTGNGCLSKNFNSSSPYNACRANGSQTHYQWGAAMNGSTTPGVQGLCPTGWHIPTYAEWNTLVNYAGGSSVAGKKLKGTGVGGTDDYGFNALLAGCRTTSGNLTNVGSVGYWWSSSPAGSNAWSRYVHSSYDTVLTIEYSRAHVFSVRCVRD